MTSAHDFAADRARLLVLAETAPGAEVDAALARLHVDYHARPLDHVRVHLLWARLQLARGSYVRALGNALAGLVVAGPASLLQRHTGLVRPAFAPRDRPRS